MDRIIEFTAAHTVLVVLFMASLFLVVFTELRRKANGLLTVEPGDAVALINNDAIVLDLRSPEAFARGHIVNAKNIPFEDFDPTSKKMARFRGKPVVTVCDAGTTSTKAVSRLRSTGFESSYGLRGGMHAWTQAGLPVVSKKKTRIRA